MYFTEYTSFLTFCGGISSGSIWVSFACRDHLRACTETVAGRSEKGKWDAIINLQKKWTKHFQACLFSTCCAREHTSLVQSSSDCLIWLTCAYNWFRRRLVSLRSLPVKIRIKGVVFETLQIPAQQNGGIFSREASEYKLKKGTQAFLYPL